MCSQRPGRGFEAAVRRLWDEGTTTSGGATWLAICAGGTVKMETGGGAGRWCLTRWASAWLLAATRGLMTVDLVETFRFGGLLMAGFTVGVGWWRFGVVGLPILRCLWRG
uniref:Uncharacterized protein n=1 Tax=Fagus sylvatica TaxID=28930 RepID=A0A2N9EE90_FAGSY